jgi:uncharacterized protein (TIGR03435 family)
MRELDDNLLLREYVDNDSDEAFATIVSRHVNKVYSVALRHTRNPHQAEEIAHAVFVILAKKSRHLGKNVVLSGWLYQTARLTAVTFIRSEIRRARREEEAYMQNLSNETEPDIWTQVAPLLDAGMGNLNATDRHAIVLRFFDGKSMREVGAALGANEVAAKKRVNRAVEKLRSFFTKRGVVLSGAVLTTAISANSVQAAPVALATSISAAKGVAATASTLTLIKGTLKTMAWIKVKTAIVIGAAILTAGTTVTLVAVNKSDAQQIESYFTRMEQNYLETAPPVVLLRPSKYANQGSYCTPGRDIYKGKVMRRGTPFPMILQTAYGFGPEKMVLPANLPGGQFDLLLTVTNDSREALRKEIKKQFGLVAHVETRSMNVLVLKYTNPNAPGLKTSKSFGQLSSDWQQPGTVKFSGYKISDPSGFDLVSELGLKSNLPVIDETGLTNTYDIDFHWNSKLQGNALKIEMQRELREQLGLELVPDRRPVRMLIVERAKN